jgi:small conductance mechanosensitive channel
MDLQNWIDRGYELIMLYGPKLLLTIVIWVAGIWVIKSILKVLRKSLEKGDYDISLKKFLANLTNWALKIVLIIVVLGTLGVETTSFAAILAAAGLAIGLALQGSLANFAGGVLIMLFKPMKIGDLIEAQGEIGVVKEIEIFTTRLIGLSNKEIIIPNGALSNGNIINYTTQGTRRVDLVFGVSYDADIKQAKDLLINLLLSHPNILKEPVPSVNVIELADCSVNFAVRPWCKSDDYWAVYFEITESAKEALDAAGIEIPYPHRVQISKQG